MAEFKVGDIVSDKYEVIGVLGEGGMGTVYRAKEIGLDRIVALKVPKDQFISNKDFMARFTREAKLVAKLSHDNIVQVYEYISKPDLVYMALEFVEGKELGKFVNDPPPQLTIGDLVNMLKRACEGVSYAHEHGVIHRDLKPANILVSKLKSGGYRVKVMDFGIAHVEQGELFTQQLTELTAAGSAMGTPSYMSPEQIQGSNVTERSDIYSMACVFYYCFTRRNLFEGSMFTVISQHLNQLPTPPNLLNPALPEAITPVILKGLAKDPAERWESAREMAWALEEVMLPYVRQPFLELFSPGYIEETSAIPIAGDAPASGDAPTFASPGAATRPGTPPGQPPTMHGAKTVSTTPTVAGSPGAKYPGLPQTQPGRGPIQPSPGFAGPGQATVATPGGVGATGQYDPTFLHAQAAVMAAEAQAKSMKWVVMLIAAIVLIVGGVGGYIVLGKKSPSDLFTAALAAGNLELAVNYFGDLTPEGKTTARSALHQKAQDSVTRVRDEFLAMNSSGVEARANEAARLLQTLGPAIGSTSSMEAEVGAWRTASAQLQEYTNLLEEAQEKPTAEAASALDELNNKLRGGVGNLVGSSFFDARRAEIAKVRAAIPKTAVPTPVPTPSSEDRAAEDFAEVEAMVKDPSVAPSVLLARLQSFRTRHPTYKTDDVLAMITKAERRKATEQEMVPIVEALRFTMGSRRGGPDKDSGSDEDPPFAADLVNPYEIGKYEVTAEAFAFFLTDYSKVNSKGEPVDKLDENKVFMIIDDGWNTVTRTRDGWSTYPELSGYPANCVTWHGAKAFAEWLSLETGQSYDLPTEAEWERAAIGKSGARTFPWGEKLEESVCRFQQLEPGRGAIKPYFADILVKVTQLPQGQSEEGVYNLSGNVAEWCSDWYGQYTADNKTNPKGPDTGRDRVLRGGSWYTSDIRYLRAKGRERHEPSSSNREIGFRVVRRK